LVNIADISLHLERIQPSNVSNKAQKSQTTKSQTPHTVHSKLEREYYANKEHI